MDGISYFPYLRGRQSELLALRDLMVVGKLSPYVIPIIEPVKELQPSVACWQNFNEVGMRPSSCSIRNMASL